MKVVMRWCGKHMVDYNQTSECPDCRLDLAREDGYEDGYKEAWSDGYQNGYSDGLDKGRSESPRDRRLRAQKDEELKRKIQSLARTSSVKASS